MEGVLKNMKLIVENWQKFMAEAYMRDLSPEEEEKATNRIAQIGEEYVGYPEEVQTILHLFDNFLSLDSNAMHDVVIKVNRQLKEWHAACYWDDDCEFNTKGEHPNKYSQGRPTKPLLTHAVDAALRALAMVATDAKGGTMHKALKR